jgi:hypothetical protein
MTDSARDPKALQRPLHDGHNGGSSDEHHTMGFAPAFLDTKTGRIHCSCMDDGRPAPVHLIATVPEDLVLHRDSSGQAIALKPSVEAGFVRDGRFFTRDEAMVVLGKSADP